MKGKAADNADPNDLLGDKAEEKDEDETPDAFRLDDEEDDEDEGDDEDPGDDDAEDDDAGDEAPDPNKAEDEEDGIDKSKFPPKLYAKLVRVRKKRDAATTDAATAREEARLLREENEQLKREKQVREERAKDPEPDPAEDAAAYRAWAKREAAREATGTAGGGDSGSERDRILKLRDQVRGWYGDYDTLVTKSVVDAIDADPKLKKRIYVDSKNPPLEAYIYAKELAQQGSRRKEDEPKLPRERGGGSGEGGGFRRSPSRAGRTTELSPEQRRYARKFKMTDKQMIAELNKG